MELATDPAALYRRYQELQTYVGWTEEDARRVQAVGPLLEPCFASLIDDFYAEIERHPEARKVITGGQAQIERLKGTLLAWLRDLFSGRYDSDYVVRRWRVGRRHVEIGLDQVYTNVALSRLRSGLLRRLQDRWQGDPNGVDGDDPVAQHAARPRPGQDRGRLPGGIRRPPAAHERLAAIGQVAGGIAHELRNPLNVVKTSVYYLLNARNATAEKTAEHLQRIERHVLLADGVITALSNFAKMPVPNLRAFPSSSACRRRWRPTRCPTTVQVTLDLPADAAAGPGRHRPGAHRLRQPGPQRPRGHAARRRI